MEKTTSEGKCIFCDKTFKKAGINRHLQKHLEEKTKAGKPGTSFLLKIDTNSRWGSTPYFLSLWIDGETDMATLDQFLRDIWLECCGHLSSFVNPKNRPKSGGGWDYFEAQELMEKGKTKEYEALMEDSNGEVPLSRKAKKVFKKGLKLEYSYDFGSTTELDVTAVSEFSIKADKAIVLLSRNEPPELLCSICHKKAATTICSVCCYEEEAQFCKTCAKKHEKDCEDFEDYAAMPIVNSPRMGVCAYEGGTIDLGRDKIGNLKVVK